jgi:predicted permease
MLLQSTAPSGANMAAFSAKFDLHPNKAALGILFTTLIAIFYMPILGGYLISFL